MAKRLVIYPPEIIDVNGNVIFLGGPIQGAPDWQAEAADIIHGIDPTIVVASPRKEYEPGTFDYGGQVDWETALLNRASRQGVIMFWLAVQVEETPGRSYAQTSRFELGEWKMRHQYDGAKLTIGIEKGFGNERYIRRRFSQNALDVIVADTLVETCHNAVELLKNGK